MPAHCATIAKPPYQRRTTLSPLKGEGRGEGEALPLTITNPTGHDRRHMTPQLFVEKWQRANLSERSAYQQHFLDLCDLLGEPKPADADPDGAEYTFERGVTKADGGKGWADVWNRLVRMERRDGKLRRRSTRHDRPHPPCADGTKDLGG